MTQSRGQSNLLGYSLTCVGPAGLAAEWAGPVFERGLALGGLGS